MALGLIATFAISIAVATFVENDFGTTTARALIYNAQWFEFLLFLITLNLFGIIVNNRLYRLEKMHIFIFHASFIVILIGAAITRFYGFEGILHLREGESKDFMLSDRAYLKVVIKDGSNTASFQKPLLLTPVLDTKFSDSIKLGSETLEVEVRNYLPNAKEIIEIDPNGKKALSLVVSAGEGRDSLVLLDGEVKRYGGVMFSLNTPNGEGVALYMDEDGAIRIKYPKNMSFTKMDDGSQGEMQGGVVYDFEKRRLYGAEGISFVLEDSMPKAKVSYASQGFTKSGSISDDLLEVRATMGGESKDVVVLGQVGKVGNSTLLELGGKQVAISYGAIPVKLPFALALRDFQLERYPGSMSPSSYASEVSVVDENASFDYRIYMNHILEHKGYRFYQASYDRDEMGTVLSVNADNLGTKVTYIGYILLAVGMLYSLATKRGRIRKLLSRFESSSASVLVALMLFAPLLGYAGEKDEAENLRIIKSFDKEHAKKFGGLLTQDAQGRVKPVDTLSTEIVNKMYGGGSLLGLTPTQALLGMLTRRQIYQNVKMIKIAHPGVNEMLGLPEGQKHAAFSEFFDTARPVPYKLASALEEAQAKQASKQSKLEKELIKVDERLNIAYMVFSGSLLRLFPKPNDENNKWLDAMSAISEFDEQSGNQVKMMLAKYFEGVDEALKSNSYASADSALDEIAKNQIVNGAKVIPSGYKIEIELIYNKLNLFKNISPYYIILGLILFIACIVHIIKPFFSLKFFSSLFGWLLAVGFLLHTAGLGLRWIISGHAPWSDGYESMIYLGWATMLAGFLFARKSTLALGATAIIAGVILFTSHLSWMDPQITNIVPVLNSYWLIIHVSMITASYGFLALGALLGFTALFLMIIKTQKTQVSIDKSLTEITMVNEMTLIIGLVMLTIGNFLGGVWANESWGRYWGWDPKQTWALVSILVYAFILHLRFIPPLATQYIFNSASLLGIFSVLMTYFGVNFYLSGLHSYAKGDPVPIPTFVYVWVAVVFFVIILAGVKDKMVEKINKGKQ